MGQAHSRLPPRTSRFPAPSLVRTTGHDGSLKTIRRPMTAEQQLERSVLEGKERDELQAIAQAMSLKTTSRTKKADIIDQILEATGVIGPEDGATDDGSTNGRPTARRARPDVAVDDGDTEPGDVAPAHEAAPALEPAIAESTAATTNGSGEHANGSSAPVQPEAAFETVDAPTAVIGGPGNTTQGPTGQVGNQQGNQRQQQNRHQQGQQGQTDAGNRRGRRRRGRERGTERGELQGTNQE